MPRRIKDTTTTEYRPLRKRLVERKRYYKNKGNTQRVKEIDKILESVEKAKRKGTKEKLLQKGLQKVSYSQKQANKKAGLKKAKNTVSRKYGKNVSEFFTPQMMEKYASIYGNQFVYDAIITSVGDESSKMVFQRGAELIKSQEKRLSKLVKKLYPTYRKDEKRLEELTGDIRLQFLKAYEDYRTKPNLLRKSFEDLGYNIGSERDFIKWFFEKMGEKVARGKNKG